MTSGGRVTSPAARNEKAHAPTRENRVFSLEISVSNQVPEGKRMYRTTYPTVATPL
jgi:hypothetical protein